MVFSCRMYIFDLWVTHKWRTTGVEKCYKCKCESIYNPLISCTDGGSSSRRKTNRNLYNNKTLPSESTYAFVHIHSLKSCRCGTVTAASMSYGESSGICVYIVFLWGPDRQADLMKTMDVAYSSTNFNLLTEPCACPCKLQHCLITLSVLYLASAW